MAQAEERTDLSLLGVSSIAEARSLSWRELLSRWAASMPAQGLQRTPVIDGWILPAGAEEMVRAGEYRHVPCLLGYAAQEGLPAAPDFQQWNALLEREYGPERAKDFLALCGDAAGFPAYNKEHYTIHCRASAEAWALLLDGQNAAPAYVYCLDRWLPGDDRGAFHASDLWYVFKTLMRSWRPWEKEDYWLAYACNTYWAQFAKTGVPQGDRLPTWTPYTADEPMTMELGKEIGMIRMPEDQRVDFRKRFLLGK